MNSTRFTTLLFLVCLVFILSFSSVGADPPTPPAAWDPRCTDPYCASTLVGRSAIADPRPDREAQGRLADVSPRDTTALGLGVLLPPDLQGDVEPELSRKVEPQLLKPALGSLSSSTEPGEPLRFIVYLGQQADLAPCLQEADRLARRKQVIQVLQEAARRSQGPVQAYLSARQATGHVRSFTSYWIFNGLGVVADAQTLVELARRPEVDVIRQDRRRYLMGERGHTAEQAPTGVEWNIQRVRADLVWDALGVDGTGVVVASMDTGVDWDHPALLSQYRGYDPKGWSQHRGNWFCATDEGYLYPGDGHGHGTHTMGLMVGREGQAAIGVAPGAQWIAVKAFHNRGYTYDSWLHASFQWLLAPEGDAALAPDVVNGSWGSESSADITFQPDVQALRTAGILPVFAACNTGPGRGTVGSPASFPESLAVGATDADDRVASFSGRGPSPWGEVKPELVAPGVGIRSSMPGGGYGLTSGTSMAAPHVAGGDALLLQAQRSLTVVEMEQILTYSAQPLGEPIPNNDTGWGLLDVYAAVTSAMDTAIISGTVTQAPDGSPLVGATVASAALDGTRRSAVTTDHEGHYRLMVAAGSYSVQASAFGYYPQIEPRVVLTGAQQIVLNFTLDPMPVGTLTGRVTEAGTGLPLSATLAAAGTPTRTQSDPERGLYSLVLPEGVYTVSVTAPAHRVGRIEAVTISAGEVTEWDVALPTAPTMLVVDGGAWYYGSEIGYLTDALDSLDYLYDLWTIRQPFVQPSDVPSVADLAPYDLVIWSAPRDSPGYVGAAEALSDFLAAGSLLLLTGQDIGYWDGGGAMVYAAYFHDYLQARYVRDDSQIRIVEGEDLLAGLSFAIQGGDGADNQLYPDEIEVRDSDYAASVCHYPGDGSAGQWVGLCRPHRALYLAFGFEAIDSASARREVMDRALSWLASPRAPVGLELQGTSRQPRVAMPGDVVSHTLRLRNTGEGGAGDRYQVSVASSSWPVTLTTSAGVQSTDAQRALSLYLSPCHSSTLTVEVGIPGGVGADVAQLVTVTASLQDEVSLPAGEPDVSQNVTLTTKTPARVLLIDDDRWYDQEVRYQAALESAGIAYDNWEVGWRHELSDGSPSSATLAMYPSVIWFTGYDWYQTLSTDEETRLIEYLYRGGRLLLSSQDYLFTQGLSPLAIDYLGVLTYTEDLTATVASGVAGSPVGDGLGPYRLAYPFPNWSDALTPTLATEAAFRGGHGYPIALTLAQERHGAPSKAAFFAFPLEALPHEPMAEVMGRAVGWLSWLGESSLSVDKALARDGERLTYTARLRNDGFSDVRVRFEGTVPTYTTYVPASASGGATYDGEKIVWEGSLTHFGMATLTYDVEIAPDLPPGTWVHNVSQVGYVDGKLSFPRWARTRINAPDLSSSDITADQGDIRPGDAIACQVVLRNEGLEDAPAAALTVTVPSAVAVIPGSLVVQGGAPGELVDNEVSWRGPVRVNYPVTLTYQAVATRTVVALRAITQAAIDDGMGVCVEREVAVLISPYRRRLFLIWKNWQSP